MGLAVLPLRKICCALAVWAALGAGGLVGCEEKPLSLSAPSPAPSSTQTQAPAHLPPPTYEIAGRATPSGLDVPPLSEAARWVENGCRALEGWPFLKVRASAPVSAPRPCSVERLIDPARPDLSAIYAVRLGGALVFTSQLSPDGDLRRARAQWSAIDPILSICLGDPFDLPPARDPGARRRLVGLHAHTWEYRFSGDGPCRLEGVLELAAQANRADAARLHVGGVAWSEGGRVAVRGWMLDQLRMDAADPGSALTEEQRARVWAMR